MTPVPSAALPFSAAARAAHLASLGEGTWDMLVVGGGVTGAGIARDAALRGLRVALVDAGDFGGGTSSRSSRLVHGGLRYLETFQFRLVFEASAERRRLLKLAPHLIHPLEFVFPVFRRGPVSLPKLLAGMWLYDGLSLFGNIRSHRMLGPAGTLAEEPRLRREGLTGAAVYFDAAVDDARLALANVRAAHEAGAATVSHAEVAAFLTGPSGKVEGARIRDRRTGTETEVRARVTVNATGPWSDAVRRLAQPSAAPRLRPTKGVHIMVRADRLGNRHAVTFLSPIDGRVMFVLPQGDFSYVGTTDTDFTGDPGTAEADAKDVDYLVASANAIYPDANLTTGDVVSTWAGIRPLLAPPRGAGSESATPREHEIWRDASGLLNIAGGKLTTYRVMALQAADRAAEILRAEHGIQSRPSTTDLLPLPGAPTEPWDAFLARVTADAQTLGLSAGTAMHLARSYGAEADALLAAIRADPGLGRQLVDGRPYVWAEVDHAVRAEMAVSLEDILRRRMQLFYETEDGGRAIARAVAERMATEPGLNWTADDVAREVAVYDAAVERTRGFRR
ncbi:MAG: dependent oxidoreductase [Gemmatimonadetes bacterium]|nr:dependent oxidoreductase [Gemmatimonadota bacterium]